MACFRMEFVSYHRPPLVGMPLGTDGSKDFTAGEAVRDRTFWYLSLGHGIALISVSAIVVHLVPHLVEDYGWSETSSQAMLMLVTITSLIGQAGGGFIRDRFDKARLAGHMHAGLCLGDAAAVVCTPAGSLSCCHSCCTASYGARMGRW